MADPVIPFANFANYGVANVEEQGEQAQANGPVQTTRLQHCNDFGLVDGAIRSAPFALTRLWNRLHSTPR